MGLVITIFYNLQVLSIAFRLDKEKIVELLDIGTNVKLLSKNNPEKR